MVPIHGHEARARVRQDCAGLAVLGIGNPGGSRSIVRQALGDPTDSSADVVFDRLASVSYDMGHTGSGGLQAGGHRRG